MFKPNVLWFPTGYVHPLPKTYLSGMSLIIVFEYLRIMFLQNQLHLERMSLERMTSVIFL
jgi:hypothetical protein